MVAAACAAGSRITATVFRATAPLCAAWILVAAASARGSDESSAGFAGSGVTWFWFATARLANQKLDAFAFSMFFLVSWNPKSPIFAAPFSSRWMLSALKSP